MKISSIKVHEMIVQLKEIQNGNYPDMDTKSIYVLVHNLRALERVYRDYEETTGILYSHNQTPEEIILEIDLLPLDDVIVPLKYVETLEIMRRIYADT